MLPRAANILTSKHTNRAAEAATQLLAPPNLIHRLLQTESPFSNLILKFSSICVNGNSKDMVGEEN